MWPVTRDHPQAALPPDCPEPREGKAEKPEIAMALLLGAIAREALGSPDAARQALEHALSLVEPDEAPPPAPAPESSCDRLTQGEARVLRYLPTHLSAREIAAELYLSMNTVRTHQRHLYDKLGAHNRAQAVARARALGLLTPAFRG
jgi:LuxR family transcriptional regulator, maltose regulon positive regulatory protein